MELRVYLDFVSRRWWLLVLGPLIAGMASYFVTQQMTPVYRATATVLVNRTATPGVIDYTDVLTSERLTNTYAELVERPAVLDEVIKRLNLSLDRQALAKKIGVNTIKDTQLLTISVTDADPAFAATLTNTVAPAFADDNASQLAPVGTVKIAKQAETPRKPTSPNLLVNVSFAAILGMIIAGGFGLLLDYFDDTVKTDKDIEEIAGLPTLGMIGRFKPKTGPAFATDLHSRSAEAYRQLRTNVHFTTLGTELKTIVITSANPEEGKSTTAANLATVLAQAGDKVILVDTDLRRSSLHKTFETSNSLGLTGLLLNDIQDPSLALVMTRWRNLQLLPAGVLPPNPSELLTSSRMIRVIRQLRQLADYVIFDTPPILAVTDAIVLAARTDGTVLVAEAGRTRSEALRQAARTLSQANARAVGVVLNKTKVRHSADYYYHAEKQTAVQIEVEAARGGLNAADGPAAVVSAARNGDAVMDQRRAVLRSPQYAGAAAYTPAAGAAERASGYTNGHANGNGNGHGNGNGNGKALAVLETAPLSAAMNDLLAHLDDTVGLIRSLKPGSKGLDA